MSHELRTPLQAILGWARLLQETDEGPARRMHGLATIERNAKVQAQLVDDILDASRLVSGTLPLEWKAVDFTAVVGKWHIRSMPTGFDHWCICRARASIRTRR